MTDLHDTDDDMGASTMGRYSPERVHKVERHAASLEADVERLREALHRLTSWSRPFIEDTPISAETLWREFPKAVRNGQEVLAATSRENVEELANG